MYLMGIDLGTGGAKAALIDIEGQECGYAFAEYPILTPRAGWSEHDPQRYWETVCDLSQKVIAQAQVEAKAIEAVAVSSALPSMVMVNRDHHPIHNAYNLMDRRATDQVEWLKAHIGEDRIFEISKNRLDDHPAMVNLMWERTNRPEQFAQIWKALTIDGFISLKLTGVASCHYSGAAFFGVAYNLLTRRFEPDILETIGISNELIPDLYRCDEVIGTVTRAAAAQTGLSAGTRVAAGQVDCNAGWIGAGAVEEGDMQMNLGTCGNFGIIHRPTNFHQSMIAFAYTTDSEQTYITVPTTTTGGQLIRYMRDNFYPLEARQAAQQDMDVYDTINREAESVAPGSEGLVVLPYLMGERTPIWDAFARGVVFGLSMHHTRGHVIRAMMESVAYALYDSFQLIQASHWQVNTPIVLNEGGAKSVLWRRIITDCFNLPTVLVKRRTGAPYGDAILAGVAVGRFKDYSVAKAWTETIEPMEPDPYRHELYMDYYRLYKKLYSHLKDDYRELADLRSKHETDEYPN